MKLELSGTGVAAIAAVAAIGGLAWLAYSKRDAVAAAAEAINPASDRNLAYRGVNSVGAAISGDSSWSVGGWLAELFDPATRAANQSLQAQLPPQLPTTGDFARADRALYYESAGRYAGSGSGSSLDDPDSSSAAPYYAP